MDNYIINTNKTIKTKEDLLISITKSTVASFKLEGIILSYDEVYKLALSSTNKKLQPQ